jgi:DNA-binding HxlR family transcriptional regulator
LDVNPLSLLEKKYTLVILQYLHLNPNGRNFEQVCSSVEKATPSEVTTRLKTLRELGLINKIKGDNGYENVYVLTKRGRYLGEIIWDIFRIIMNPRDADDDEDFDVLNFYR